VSTPLKTRVLIADDHTIVRRGLRALLDEVPDLEVVAEAADGADAVSRVLEGDVHLAVLDITMPRMTGLQAVQEIARRAPQVKTLILSMHEDEQYFFQALRMGASGYVLKSAADRDLVEACRAAMRGEPFVHAGAVTALIEDYLERVRRGDAADVDPLTPREQQVVKLIAEAYTNEQIARELVISVKTVERHRANLMEKLGMRDRVQLTRYAIRRGLVVP
jgi:DNA-binding NarL/FixJ family response regulator